LSSVARRESCDLTPQDVLNCGMIVSNDIIVDFSEFCDSLDTEYSLEDLTFMLGKYVGLNFEPSVPLPAKTEQSKKREEERLIILKKDYISCFSALAERASIIHAQTYKLATLPSRQPSKIELSRKSVQTESDLIHRESDVRIFAEMSPLCSTLDVRPDFWVRMGDIPVLLIQIVSGSQGKHSVKQTLLKSICNTIDLLRLYMNLREARISEVSSIVLPQSRGQKCGAIMVTVQFGIDASWKFRLSFRKIALADVARQMENIIESNRAFLSTEIRSDPWYFLKLESLPPGMKQQYSKHSIVLKAVHQNGTVRNYYKFSPRVMEREHLSTLFRSSRSRDHNLFDQRRADPLDGEKRVAVIPCDEGTINGLSFFGFPAVEPPLSDTCILRCFSRFAIQSALALRALHIYDQIAHLDVRTFNTCFILTGKENSQQAKVVFIDLDRSTEDLDRKQRVSTVGAQYVQPPMWSEGVPFSARNCDWRQWALMLWSVLKHADAESIYSGELISSGQPFLDSILSGSLSGMDTKSDPELISMINGWLLSTDFQNIKPSSADFDSTSLIDQVRLHP
jgi:hypothetical protein